MFKRLLLIVLAVMALGVTGLNAQRRVTPVTPRQPGTSAPVTDLTKKPIDPSRLVTTTDANGNTVTVDTVTGREYVDSTLLPPPPKMIYPLVHQAIVGVNIWDGFMRCLSQKYGIGDIWGEVSLHNRYFPFFAVGLGNISDTPINKNFTYKTPIAPYFKLGASYNFFYNSNPDYRLQAGLRYGFSAYKWTVSDVTVDEGYWDNPTGYSMPTQSATAGYLEIVLALKVKIFRNFSAGWNVLYHSVIHQSSSAYGNPMYIPGYGKRNGAITANFSLIYTLPLNNKTLPEVEQ
ncbi:MAG: hypothetical protein HDR97_06870 [Bacteroides sp.]|nr:hypothetical protein [Bacteroides sp.]